MEVTDPEGGEGGGVFPRADLNGLGRLVSGYGFGSTWKGSRLAEIREKQWPPQKNIIMV